MALDFEQQFYNEKVVAIAGCDEAGRGPLLGPVVAAAVILPIDYKNNSINDSKKLSEAKREELYNEIKENALAIGIGVVSSEEIDKINIYEASRKAMVVALNNLKAECQLVLTDAMPLYFKGIKVIPIIKGDAKAQCIAAASIIAKVTRDHMMEELDLLYPLYGIKKHKGYGTKQHIEAIKKYGPIKGVHRFTFKPIKNMFEEKISLF